MTDSMPDTPYIYYKFLGVRSFIDTLTEAGTEHRLFSDDDFSPLYARDDDILTLNTDTIRSGIIVRDGQRAYFAEFGIKITPGHHSYIVFIFDHHPNIDEFHSIVDELEAIISAALENVDISRLSDAMEESKRGQDDALN